MLPITAERYAAFLITYLPRFAAVAAARLDEPSGPRIRPLEAAHSYVAGQPGVSLEFGVYKGASINFTATQFPNRKYFGFDSFEGFPDDGRPDWRQDFSVSGALPEVPANVTLIKGFFSETLPTFLETLQEDVCIVNIDCDIYSSTREVFNYLGHKGILKAGLVLSFDELINYNGFLWNEMFALFEMLEETGLGLNCISVHKNVRSIEEVAALHRSESYPTWASDVQNGYRQQASIVLTSDGLDLSALKMRFVKNRVEDVADFLIAASRAAPSDVRRKLTATGNLLQASGGN